MSTRRGLKLTREKKMNSIARFFENVRRRVAGQPLLDDHFDQGRWRPQGAADEHAARIALGTTDVPPANKAYIRKPKAEPWQNAEVA